MRLLSTIHAVFRLSRAALILLAAGVTGGGVMLCLLVLGGWVLTLTGASNQALGGFLLGVVAFPFWLVGAAMAGPPLWAMLHLVGLRGRRTAVTAGSLAAGSAAPVALWAVSHDSVSVLEPNLAAGLAVISVVAATSGAVAGLVVHNLAYGCEEDSDGS